MTRPAPFAYPTAPHVRRHGPSGYDDYGTYKPFLRDEFTFRCVYCMEREVWYPNRDGSFSADHFIPKKIDPAKETDYTNLVYACVRCNSYKQVNIVELDPCQVAFSEHFQIDDEGRISGISPPAQDMIDLLHLDENPALATRKRALRVLKLKAKYPDDPDIDALLVEYFGFPEDLPDLRSLRPKSNTRKAGIDNCHYERKKKGVLPETY